MRRLLSWVSWLLMVPFFVAASVFALHNDAPVQLNLWPFGMAVEIPIYLVLFGTLMVGILIGGLVSWMGQGRVRSNLRNQVYDGEVARRELMTEREKNAALVREIETLKIPTPPDPRGDLANAQTISFPKTLTTRSKVG